MVGAFLQRIYADDKLLNPREVSHMRATVILFLVFSLLSPPALFAADADSPFQQSVARAARAALAQRAAEAQRLRAFWLCGQRATKARRYGT